MKKKINHNFLIIGIFYIIGGILTLIKGKTIPIILILILGDLLLIRAVSTLITLFFKKNKKLTNTFIFALLEIFLGLFLLFKTKVALSFISVIFALYLLIFAAINIIDLTIHLRNKISGKLAIIFNLTINMVFFFLLITSPYQNIEIVITIISIYLILYGINNITDYLVELLPISLKDKIKYHFYVPLPIIIAAITPHQLVKKINNNLILQSNKKRNATDNIADLDIIIHLAESGTATFGHVDIAYKNKIYSYGNYNRHSRRLFDSIGDGIFMIADKEKYIEYMTEKQHRYLIIYGINLNNNQKNLLEKTIENNIYKNTISWQCDLELSKNQEDNYSDMSSELYKYCDASYKKVIKGVNKKFFVFKTNCTLVAETLIRPLGRAVLPISGIITPGTYYDCLEREYNKNNSNVISKHICYKENDH